MEDIYELYKQKRILDLVEDLSTKHFGYAQMPLSEEEQAEFVKQAQETCGSAYEFMDKYLGVFPVDLAIAGVLEKWQDDHQFYEDW